MAREWVPFSPTAQTVRITAAGNVQQGRRRLVVMRDQHRNAKHPHGRAWWGWVEKQAADDALHPGLVGELCPVATFSRIPITKTKYEDCEGWQAPWYPPPGHVNKAMDLSEGNHFVIPYDVIAVEWDQAQNDYYQRATTAAISHDLPIPRPGGLVDFAVQAICGLPTASPRIPRAAKTGHEWLLGFSNERDEVLDALLNPMVNLEQIAEAAEKLQRERGIGPSGDQIVNQLRQQLADQQKQMDQMAALFKEAISGGEEIHTPSPEKPKKRTMTPERLAALARGRATAKANREAAQV